MNKQLDTYLAVVQKMFLQEAEFGEPVPPNKHAELFHAHNNFVVWLAQHPLHTVEEFEKEYFGAEPTS